MPRLPPKSSTVRLLFAKSWNRCAFPGCTQVLVNAKGQFLGQICHIEAASPEGERFNPSMTDEDRRHHDNLILLCYPHHVETDEIAEYPTAIMKEMKNRHETRTGIPFYKIDEAHLHSILRQSEKYWTEIEKLAAFEASIRDLAMEVDPSKTFLEMIQEIQTHHDWLSKTLQDQTVLASDLPSRVDAFAISYGASVKPLEELPYYEHPFRDSNWERLNIGVPNIFTKLRLALTQIEIRYLEEFLKTNHPNAKETERLDLLKKSLKELIKSSGYVD